MQTLDRRRVMTRVALFFVLVMSAATAAVSCDGEKQGADAETIDSATLERRRATLVDLGESVILETYVRFAASTRGLRDAVVAYEASGSSEDLEAAREAWRQAAELWQQSEVFQIGPAGVMGEVAGGEDLRDEIYSWPITNPCRVDQELVSQDYEDAGAFAAETVNVRGLDALEYLLFKDGTGNACAPQSAINTDGSWAALDATALQSRRARYAQTLAELLVGHAEVLQQAWARDGGDFLGELERAGSGSAAYQGVQEALNALSDAMFYLDAEVKDMKVARPVGLMDCTTDTCPEDLESPFAHRSRDHVLANLRGFQRLFVGGDDTGFDDLLRDLGADALADSMTANIAAAITAVEAVQGSFADALASDPQSIIDAHAAIKRVTDQMKTEFISLLDLELPQRAEGDND